MDKFSTMLYLKTMNTCDNAARYVCNEINRIKNDEGGMELVQIVIILLMVILIAAAVWQFLGTWISELLEQVFDTSLGINESGITQPN